MSLQHLSFADYSIPEASAPYFAGVPLYVNKDELIEPILQGRYGRQLIFSRPAGFGRTTLLMRLKYLALKRKRPVLYLDVKQCDHVEDLACPEVREIISSSGPDLVLLIDNYDYPLTSSLPKGPDDDGPYLNAAQRLSSTLNPLLDCAARSKVLTFITGTLHFEKNMLLNSESLVDVTCERALAALVGYTQAEFSYYFTEKLSAVSFNLRRSRSDLEVMLYHHLCRWNFVPNSKVRLYSPRELEIYFADPEDLIPNGMAEGLRLARLLQPLLSQLTAPPNTYFCGQHTLSKAAVLKGLTSLHPDPILALFQFGLFTLPPSGSTLSNVSTPRMAGLINELIRKKSGVDLCSFFMDFITRRPIDQLMIHDSYSAGEVLDEIWNELKQHGMSGDYNHPEYWKVFLCLMLPLSSMLSSTCFEMKDCRDNLHSPFLLLQFENKAVLILLTESDDAFEELRDLGRTLSLLAEHCPPDSLLGLYPEGELLVRAVICNKNRLPNGFTFENLTWMFGFKGRERIGAGGDIQPVQLRETDSALSALAGYRKEKRAQKLAEEQAVAAAAEAYEAYETAEVYEDYEDSAYPEDPDFYALPDDPAEPEDPEDAEGDDNPCGFRILTPDDLKG